MGMGGTGARDGTRSTIAPVPALTPRGQGHQFVCYADCCSGIPGARHEATFASVNRVIARLSPQPDFILFPGDHVVGLTADDDALRSQWRHWFEHEMAWLDRRAVPLYHTPGNHDTYDAASEQVWREVMRHLPRNGPAGQEGLSYFVRRGDLLLVFVHTLSTRLGGEGRVERDWLDEVLSGHADAAYKLVVGHHPVHPVNGFSGPYQREIAPEYGRPFWSVLVKHRVLAYLCSHILAFDVQAHEGVLQIVTAGAGTAHRMPPDTEYLHFVQAALDVDGLRYQVIDVDGHVREWLRWPFAAPDPNSWRPVERTPYGLPLKENPPEAGVEQVDLRFWRFSGIAAAGEDGSSQTLVAGWGPGPSLASFWAGLEGPEQRVIVRLAPEPGRSPHTWIGPTLAAGQRFDLTLAVHRGMGPGGVLWRWGEGSPWSSMSAASPWGAERLQLPVTWSLGHDRRGATDRPFRGQHLRAASAATRERLPRL